MILLHLAPQQVRIQIDHLLHGRCWVRDDVVDDNVDHQEHAAFVQFGREGEQVGLVTESRVKLGGVLQGYRDFSASSSPCTSYQIGADLDPIAMVSRPIGRHRVDILYRDQGVFISRIHLIPHRFLIERLTARRPAIHGTNKNETPRVRYRSRSTASCHDKRTGDSRNPNRIETHTLDIIQLVDDTSISPATPAKLASGHREKIPLSAHLSRQVVKWS